MAIRHIKYGVKAEYVESFGVVLSNVLAKLLGEGRGGGGDGAAERSQAAWAYVWSGVSQCMSDCLNIGSSLVTVALVTGEVEELERALALAPRGQRADWITRVQIHDSVVSPLYWAIKDGKLDMARVMLKDLLAIRADSDAYYYGCQRLWAVHPDVASVLCSICPELVNDFLDGLLWHSARVDHGLVSAPRTPEP